MLTLVCFVWITSCFQWVSVKHIKQSLEDFPSVFTASFISCPLGLSCYYCTMGRLRVLTKCLWNSLHRNKASWALTEPGLMLWAGRTRGVCMSTKPARGCWRCCWEEGKSPARLRDAFEGCSFIWYDFIKLTFKGQIMRYAAFRHCIHKPAHCWDKSGFKPRLSIYLIHLFACCQLAWKVLLSKTISSYFFSQNLQSVCMIWKNYFQDFWLHSIQALDFTAGTWAHSLAFVRAFTAGHPSWEGCVSCSKYSLSHVIFDTSLAIAGWQHITPGKPSPKNEQGSFVCVMSLQLEWGEVLEVRGVSLWLHCFGTYWALGFADARFETTETSRCEAQSCCWAQHCPGNEIERILLLFLWACHWDMGSFFTQISYFEKTFLLLCSTWWAAMIATFPYGSTQATVCSVFQE